MLGILAITVKRSKKAPGGWILDGRLKVSGYSVW